jgi:hypothetical protein
MFSRLGFAARSDSGNAEHPPSGAAAHCLAGRRDGFRSGRRQEFVEPTGAKTFVESPRNVGGLDGESGETDQSTPDVHPGAASADAPPEPETATSKLAAISHAQIPNT